MRNYFFFLSEDDEFGNMKVLTGLNLCLMLPGGLHLLIIWSHLCVWLKGGVSTTPLSDLWVSWVESIKCTFHRFVLRSCSEHLSYVVTNLAQTWRFPPGPVGRSTVNWSRVNWSNALQTREMGMPQCRWLEGWMKSWVQWQQFVENSRGDLMESVKGGNGRF